MRPGLVLGLSFVLVSAGAIGQETERGSTRDERYSVPRVHPSDVPAPEAENPAGPAETPALPAWGPGPRLGEYAPAFALEDVRGKEWSLADFRGRRTLVLFWAPWDVSRADLREWERLAGPLRHRRFEVVAIAPDVSGVERARGAMRESGADFPVLVDRDLSVTVLYGVREVPRGLLLDANGRVILQVAGPPTPEVQESIRRKIDIQALPPAGLEVRRPPAGRNDVQELRRRMREAPQDPSRRLALADGCREAGRLGEARTELREALRLLPGESLLWVRLAAVECDLRLRDEAAESLRRALELDPESDILAGMLLALLRPGEVYDGPPEPRRIEAGRARLRAEALAAATATPPSASQGRTGTKPE